MEDQSVSEYQYTHPTLGRRTASAKKLYVNSIENLEDRNSDFGASLGHLRSVNAQQQQLQQQPPTQQQQQQQQQPRTDRPRPTTLEQPILCGWPRCGACCIGVFIPLNVLVIVSLIFGMLYGWMEKAAEVTSNNLLVKSKMTDLQLVGHLDDVLERLPELCLKLFEQGEDDIHSGVLQSLLEDAMTDSNNKLDSEKSSFLDTYLQPTTFANDSSANLIPRNKSLQELSSYLAKCGEQGGIFRDNWLSILFNETEDQLNMVDSDADLTFNYVRCVNRSNPLTFNFIIVPTQEDIEDSRPGQQAELYEQSWLQSQQKLEQQYNQQEGYSDLEALSKSFDEATGEEYCAVNMPSAAWFWFTVMSTVGYGNQVPNSFGGRMMTYTLGFVSILLFGGVLATAGTITTHLLNDFVHRCKRKVSKTIIIIIWGVLWLLWMLVMASYFVNVQNMRMGLDNMSLGDGYWLAYISTTTVGFGDYYLNPEVLFVSDLLILWATFLFGFVLLSSFLTELSNAIGGSLPNLGEIVQRELKYAYEPSGEVTEQVRISDEIRASRPPKRGNSLIRALSGLHMNSSLADYDESSSEEDDDASTNNNNSQKQVQPAQGGNPAKTPNQTVVQQESAPAATKSKVPTTIRAAPPATKTAPKSPPKTKTTVPQPTQSTAQPATSSNTNPKAVASTPPPQTPPAAVSAATMTATFINTGTKPSMTQAQLYHESTFFANLGRNDPPVTVQTYAGHRWFIVANGVYAEQFTIESGVQGNQVFSF